MAIIALNVTKGARVIVQTKVFDLLNGKYNTLSELAKAIGISVSQVYRVREGKRNINQKFVIGAVQAFPEYRFDDLFYFVTEPAPQTKGKDGD